MDLLLVAGILVTMSVKEQCKEIVRGTDQNTRLKSSEGVEIRVRQECAAGMSWRRETLDARRRSNREYQSCEPVMSPIRLHNE